MMMKKMMMIIMKTIRMGPECLEDNDDENDYIEENEIEDND